MPAPRVPLNDTIDVDPLTLSPTELNASPSLPKFKSRSLWVPYGARGAFGGQTIAQALTSAGKTVPDHMGLHSQVCYFLWPAAGDIPVTYEVEVLRTGRNYATRLVRGKQQDKLLIIVMCSYATSDGQSGSGTASSPPFSFLVTPTQPAPPSAASPRKAQHVSASLQIAAETTSPRLSMEDDQSHSVRSSSSRTLPFRPRVQYPFPRDIIPYEQSETEEERWARWIKRKGINWDHPARKMLEEYVHERRESAMSLAVARRRADQNGRDGHLGHNTWANWLCARVQPGDRKDPEFAKAVIAFMSDFQFVGVAARSLGLTRGSTPKLSMLASLDHTTHFYPFPPDFDIAQPLLYVVECPVSDVAASRGLVRGLMYTQKGHLIAVTHQEGVIRADMPGKKESGLVEQGVVKSGEQRKKKKGSLAKL